MRIRLICNQNKSSCSVSLSLPNKTLFNVIYFQLFTTSLFYLLFFLFIFINSNLIDQSYQLQEQVNISVKFSHWLYKVTSKTIRRPHIKSFSLTSPKAPRPITFNISKSSLCNRICFTLEVNGLAETKEQHHLLS